MNDILDETEVAAMLACEPSTVLTMARERQLPGVQFGRSWRFPRTALLEVVNRRALEHVTAKRPDPTAVTRKEKARKGPPILPSLNQP